MKRKFFALLLFVLASSFCAAQNSDFLDYVEKYKKIAVEEMERAGIPASIKLAQALLESNAGKSELARKANNHFGIKCHSDWTGRTYEIEDDDYDEFGNLKKSCFRKYKDAEDSFIAHSEFLRDPKKANRYGFLFKLSPQDYKRWAKGLRTSGYATGANYDDKLIRIVETYKLYELDQLSDDNFPEGRPEKPEDAIAGLDLRKVNDVKVVFAKNNVTVQEISERAHISLSRLDKYNDLLPSPNAPLADDTRIFLQPKRCRNRGTKWHYVQNGESIFDISQLYGVNLQRLYKRNRLKEGEQPQPDQRIKLKGWNIRESDKPRTTTERKPTSTVPPLLEGDDDWMEEEVWPEEPDPTPVKPPVTPPSQPTKPPVAPPAQPGATYHTVAKGDTLFNISRKYGITVDEMKRLNNLGDTTIKLGQVLRVR